MATKAQHGCVDDADLNSPDTDDDGTPDPETFPVPNGSGITDPYLRSVWDDAVKSLGGEEPPA